MEYTFENDGFVIIKNTISNNVIREINSLTDEIIEYSQLGLEDPFSKYYLRHRIDQGALYDLFQRHPEFHKLAKNNLIISKLKEVLGENIFLYENSLVYKPKGKRNEVPWHQDFMNRPDEPIKYIAWIALNDINKENGALKVIPGSHKLGFLPWHSVEGETHHTRLILDGVDLSNSKYVELNAGDVLIFNQLLLHSSDRIKSEVKRRAYRVSYQGFDQVFTPRASPIVLSGGRPNSIKKIYPETYQPIPPKTPEIRVEKTIIKRLIIEAV